MVWDKDRFEELERKVSDTLEGKRPIDRSEVKEDLQRLLPESISKKLANRLRGMDRTHCAILLRYGSLRPFVHLSICWIAELEEFRMSVLGYPASSVPG